MAIDPAGVLPNRRTTPEVSSPQPPTARGGAPRDPSGVHGRETVARSTGPNSSAATQSNVFAEASQNVRQTLTASAATANARSFIGPDDAAGSVASRDPNVNNDNWLDRAVIDLNYQSDFPSGEAGSVAIGDSNVSNDNLSDRAFIDLNYQPDFLTGYESGDTASLTDSDDSSVGSDTTRDMARLLDSSTDS